MKKTKEKNYRENFVPLEFPKDEQKHNHIIEWWYFNGNLESKEKENFSYMDCFFSAKTKEVNIPFLKNIPVQNIFFSHYLLAGKDKINKMVNPFCLVDKNNFQKPLLWINYDNGCLIHETKPFVYHIVNDFIDLELKSTKKPLLLDKKGFIDLGVKTTYYYSLTRLETSGLIKVNNKWIEVKGLSWMDHQWAQTPLTSDDEWTWFSIQLNDGTDILCFSYGNKIKSAHASILDKNNHIYSTNNISIKPIGSKYISSTTKIEYELDYLIEIPEYGISLKISPVKKNQEMNFETINYWEGGIDIKGTIKNKPVSGKGFLELVPFTNKKILKAVIRGIKKNSLMENFRNIANISTKTIYALNERLKK